MPGPSEKSSPQTAGAVGGSRPDALGVLSYLVFVAIGGGLVFAFAWSLEPAAASQAVSACRPLSPEPRSGAAPEVALEDMQGNAVTLADYRGKFVVLNFWATWCEPCSREWPDLDKLSRRLGDRSDVVVLAVSIDEDREEIEPYLKRLRLEQSGVNVLWDPSGGVNKSFGSEKIPDTFFIDERGQLRSAFINARSWGKAEAFHCVDSMIGR
jgi:peroxiredoxin